MPSDDGRLAELNRQLTRLKDAFYDPDAKSADLSPLSRRMDEVQAKIDALVAEEGEAEEDAATPDEPFDPSAI